ncbi:uncharacterized protein LOC126826713 isoform X2 [Patella vulgata]|uniref:uncharacterized protein LOC126826713 isoform X2 n=1 Tax=Patella vulgata TaxID=6465 RepID=UPI002180648F|nr:uncharacterized protein LOC126826713 isoform X2 [Patella vulgata]
MADESSPTQRQKKGRLILSNYTSNMNADLRKMVTDAEAPYAQCEIHDAEMMEKNIACIVCQKLVCALCLRDFHLSHEIMSVIKLRELKQLGGSIESDVNTLQSCQLHIQTQLTQRSEVLEKIEKSKESLISNIDKAFEQLHEILKNKHEDVLQYIMVYYNRSHEVIKNDIDILSERYKEGSAMIKRVLSFFNKLHVMLKESPDLPKELKKMSESLTGLPPVGNVEQMMVDVKFDKILPSLQAISNICQSIHPEATKICWSRVTPAKTEPQSPTEAESTLMKPQSVRVSARNLAKKCNTAQSTCTSTTESPTEKKKGSETKKLSSVAKKNSPSTKISLTEKSSIDKPSVKKPTTDELSSDQLETESASPTKSESDKVTSTGTQIIDLPVGEIVKNTVPSKRKNIDESVDGEDALTKKSKTVKVNCPVHNKDTTNSENIDKQASSSNKNNSTGHNYSLKCKQVINNPDMIDPRNIKKEFEILNFDPLQLETGEIGKDRTYSLCGEEDTSFGQGKTVYLLETSMIDVNNLICSFKYDFQNNIPDVLNDEINKALLFKNV